MRKADRGPGTRSHLRWDGKPKVEYATVEEAAAIARSIEDSDLLAGRAGRIPWPYECIEGGHWHVGSVRYSHVPAHTRGAPSHFGRGSDG